MKTLFLILLTSLTFAQSPFWKMELMENETAPSTPDITTDLVALWQDGDTVDVTGRGNDLTRNHTNPEVTPAEWSGGPHKVDDLILYESIVWRSLTDENTDRPGQTASWTIHAPYKVSTGLTGIDSAIQFNGIDHYLSRASTTDLQLGGTDFTIAVWVKISTPGACMDKIYAKGDYATTIEYELFFDNDCTNGVGYEFADGAGAHIGEVASQDAGWHFVTMTKSGTTYTILVDNDTANPFGSGTISISNTAHDFFVGTLVMGETLNGSIAQLAIYKRALTQEQITYLYNGGDGRLIVP